MKLEELNTNLHVTNLKKMCQIEGRVFLKRKNHTTLVIVWWKMKLDEKS